MALLANVFKLLWSTAITCLICFSYSHSKGATSLLNIVGTVEVVGSILNYQSTLLAWLDGRLVMMPRGLPSVLVVEPNVSHTSLDRKFLMCLRKKMKLLIAVLRT